jgi:subtilisin-like proprotein convertase family protein
MSNSMMRTRVALVVLAALLTLPVAQWASPGAAKPRSKTVTRTFANTGAIAIPSAIEVTGLKGRIRDVNLRLNSFSHERPLDVEVLLVGPGGQTAIVMAWVGGEQPVSGVMLRLDDEAAKPLPEAYDIELKSGAYWPVNGSSGVMAFASPAPTVSRANAGLAVFDGTDPNGTWQLFVQDQYALNKTGAFNGGWELEVQAQVKAKKKR